MERKNKYNKTVALWCHVYLYTHFALALAAHQMVLQYKNVSNFLYFIYSSCGLIIACNKRNTAIKLKNAVHVVPLSILTLKVITKSPLKYQTKTDTDTAKMGICVGVCLCAI